MRGETRIALVAALWLGGCVAHIDDKIMASEDFKTSGKGIAVLDATPLESACHTVKFQIAAHGTAEADWRTMKFVTAQYLFSNDTGDGDRATEFTLEPGEYGIMQVSCEIGNRWINMVEKIENESRRTIFGSRTQFRRVASTPLATFSVAGGEVVDLGSISAHQTGPTTFVPVFAPMGADVRARFQAAKPTLAGHMVSRPLIPAGRVLGVPPLRAPPPTQ
jgi:hypothetical protein